MSDEQELAAQAADVARSGGVVANVGPFRLDETVAYFDREAQRLQSTAGSSREREDLVFQRILPRVAPQGTKGLRAVDFGCGAGSLLHKLLAADIVATGVELSPGMVAEAREQLRRHGFPPERVVQGSVDRFADVRDRSLDVVFVMGVLQYLPPAIYEAVFHEAHRVLAPGGSLVCSFQNAFFDLFTFNKYTMQFYEQSLIGPILPAVHDVAPVMDALRGLVTNPMKPEYRKEIARDNILVRTTNPLTVEQELRDRGFAMQEKLFYEFHPLPPLLRNQFPETFAALKQSLEVHGATDWRGYFMANALLTVNTRVTA